MSSNSLLSLETIHRNRNFFPTLKLNIFVLNLIFQLLSTFISNTHSLWPLTPHVKQPWVISSSPVSHITLKSLHFLSPLIPLLVLKRFVLSRSAETLMNVKDSTMEAVWKTPSA